MPSDQTTKRLLVFARRFPPSRGGAPTVLKNLFDAIPDDRYAALSMDDGTEGGKTVAEERHARLSAPGKISSKVDKRLFFRIPEVLRRARAICPPEDTAGVLLVNPVCGFEVAGWRYARKHGLPLLIYFLDECQQLARTFPSFFARKLQRRIFADASTRFCINPMLRQYHFEKHFPRLSFRDLPIPAPPLSSTGNVNAQPAWRHGTAGLIAFTGQIHVNYNLHAIRQLIGVLQNMREPAPKLVLATPDPEHRLQQYGLAANEHVDIVSLGTEECRALQEQADLLFLPVPVKPSEQSYVQTAFPSKTIEYLASDTRILLVGHSDIPFLQYMKTRGLGRVLESPTSETLSKAVAECIQRPDLTPAEKSARDAEVALHDPGKVAETLMHSANMR